MGGGLNLRSYPLSCLRSQVAELRLALGYLLRYLHSAFSAAAFNPFNRTATI